MLFVTEPRAPLGFGEGVDRMVLRCIRNVSRGREGVVNPNQTWERSWLQFWSVLRGRNLENNASDCFEQLLVLVSTYFFCFEDRPLIKPDFGIFAKPDLGTAFQHVLLS